MYLHQIDASNRAIKESNSRTVRLLFEFWYSMNVTNDPYIFDCCKNLKARIEHS